MKIWKYKVIKYKDIKIYKHGNIKYLSRKI